MGRPRPPGVVVHVYRKPGTALGMSVAGGRGSVPFIGNDQVSNDTLRRLTVTVVFGYSSVTAFGQVNCLIT